MMPIKSIVMRGPSENGLFSSPPHVSNCQRVTGICIAFAVAGTFAAAAQDRPVASGAPIVFHILAQPLANALQAYGQQTGVQILYESHSAVGQQSLGVEGSFTPEEALNRLLTGTDLKVRYTGPNAITLSRPRDGNEAPPPSLLTKADLTLGTLRVRANNTNDDHGRLSDYSESVQADVQKALQKSARTRGGSYRLVLDIWIDGSRMIERIKLYQSTGDPDRDDAVATALRGATISRPAPANMPQPVRVSIVVQSAQ